MSTTSDILNTPLSGLNHIDALLDTGPDWNFATTTTGNTITYTFSTASGVETFTSSSPGFNGNISSFSSAQQAGTRAALAYVSAVTGIKFVETSTGTNAQLHFANADLNSSTSTTGLCSWSSSYSFDRTTNELITYKPNAYIYLDNAEFGQRNAQIAAGSSGYETLLHELGHALGLKHPFDDAINLPGNVDNTQYTLMSYNSVGGVHSVYSPYDIAALNWLYGGDGLGGALGIGSSTGARYLTGSGNDDILTGTAANDVLRGNGGNDVLNGGDGTDTAIFSGASTAYSALALADGSFKLSGLDGIDILNSIEIVQFSNGNFTRAQLLDTSAPAAPTLGASLNANGYVTGSTPVLFGIAEAGATVKLYNGSTLLGSTVSSAQGFWTLTASALADGSYTLYSTATDAAGNVSAHSANLSFNVDAHAPAAPLASVSVAANQPAFSGTGEAGSTISLTSKIGSADVLLGQTTVDAGGSWSVTSAALADGSYAVTVTASDLADNSSSASAPLAFSISSALNRAGTDGKDSLSGTAGNNAFDGKGGIDTVVYGGVRSGFTVAKSTLGFSVSSSATGVDTLVDVERVQFGDISVALDVNGHGGQAYRMFTAALDRAPLPKGLGFWIDALDKGFSLESVAANFLAVPEFGQRFGTNLSNGEFVNTLFEHVLHRAPKQAGYDFWTAALDSGVSRAHVLMQFSESPENQAQVLAAIQNGVEYTLWQG